MNGVRSERIEHLDAVMRNAGFDARLSSAIEQEMWDKWMFLATLAGVTCLMRGSIGDIVGAPGGREFVDRFFDEAVAVAAAHGHAPSGAFLAQTRALLTADGSTLTSSMFRDSKKGARSRPTRLLVIFSHAAGKPRFTLRCSRPPIPIW